MLQLTNITLRRGTKVLLEETSLRLDVGYKAGLIGKNGAGKTSLLKLITHELQEDQGEIQFPSTWKIAQLSQELPETNDTAFAFVRNGDAAWVDIQNELTQAENNDDGMAIAHWLTELEVIDGYRIDSRVAIILKGLGFSDEEQEKPVKSFSGGWQMRLQLARVLMSRADLLLLDEPTNHLDFETIAWLVQWAKDYKGTCIIISHDRYFLDEVTTHTIQLANQKLKLFQGNYSSFARQFEEALLLQEKVNQKILKKRAHLQKFIDRFGAKASKAKQAQSRAKALEKLKTSSDWQEDENSISFEFFEPKSTGYPTISIRADLGYRDKTVLKNVSLSVGEGDRIGVIGINGSGKSTLLKSIAKEIQPVKGEMYFHSQTHIGYFSQDQVDMLELDETPLDHFKSLFPDVSESQARGFLGRFAFSHDRVFQKVGLFSGGEKARLALALLVWKKPNVLLLDEPTNHLDMSIREAVILALESFTGALLLVSHDRYFVECCVDQLWLVKDGTVNVYDGTLAEYEQSQLVIPPASTQQKATTPKTPKITDKESKKAIQQIERDIVALEKQLQKIEKELADPALYEKNNADKLKQLSQQQTQLKKDITAKENEWMSLS